MFPRIFRFLRITCCSYRFIAAICCHAFLLVFSLTYISELTALDLVMSWYCRKTLLEGGRVRFELGFYSSSQN